MKKFIPLVLLSSLIMPLSLSVGQDKTHDKAVYTEIINPFKVQMDKDIEEFGKKPAKTNKTFKLDFTGFDLPESPSQFNKQWHNTPINQGETGTCWCFSTTSFFESEIYRLTKRQIKLSELYTVYWEYVEKAKRYVRERGNSEFAEGSESNALRRLWPQYGVVPEEAYTGKLPGQKHHDHSKLIKEMSSYLETVKANNNWDEEAVVSTIKSILNHYLGEPPLKVKAEGQEMTPKEYLQKVVKLNMDDYVDIISLKQSQYYKKMEYPVPDNWWHDSDYYNVPLDEYMSLIKNAVRKGYTVVIGGDVSEPGYDFRAEAAVVPTFDIPSEYINEDARQFRFDNGSTADDHGIHMVGYMDKNDRDWFLIKDSAAGAHGSKNPGYYFYHEDYVKLKMIDFMVHKDIAQDVLKKFN